jgi:hypothetical protein
MKTGFQRPCMGGMCELREGCAHYHSQHIAHPVERRCLHGDSDQFTPYSPGRQSIRIHKAAAEIFEAPQSSIFRIAGI